MIPTRVRKARTNVSYWLWGLSNAKYPEVSAPRSFVEECELLN